MAVAMEGKANCSRRKKSVVWKYFEELNSKETKCKICKNTLAYTTASTSSMKTHLVKIHKIDLSESDETMSEGDTSKKSATLHSFGITKCSKLSQENLNHHIMQLIVRDLQPFSMVEDEGFRRLFKFLQPNSDLKLPSRTHLRNTIIPKTYDDIKLKLKDTIKGE